LEQVPGTSRTYTIEAVAKRMERVGALSTSDVVHVMQEFIYELREVLKEGDRVKVDKLGTFYLSFHSKGTKTEEECTAKAVDKLKVRFREGTDMHLYNASTSTRSDDSVHFTITTLGGGGETSLVVSGVSLNNTPVSQFSGTLTVLAGSVLKITGTGLSATAIQASFATSPAGLDTDRPLSDIGSLTVTSTQITITTTIAKAYISRLLKVDDQTTLFDFEEQ
jgi:nucleoid DNA-binding protein